MVDFVFWFCFCFFLSSTNALIRKKLWNLNSFNYVISNNLNDFYWNKTPTAIDDYYGCLFVAKLSWRKIFFFFWKGICVSYKIYIICKKNVLIWNKSFILKISFTEKNFFYRENYKWKCKKYISHLKICFYTENVYVTNKV